MKENIKIEKLKFELEQIDRKIKNEITIISSILPILYSILIGFLIFIFEIKDMPMIFFQETGVYAAFNDPLNKMIFAGLMYLVIYSKILLINKRIEKLFIDKEYENKKNKINNLYNLALKSKTKRFK